MGKDHANYKPNVAQHNFIEQQLVTCTQQELWKNINIKKKVIWSNINYAAYRRLYLKKLISEI